LLLPKLRWDASSNEVKSREPFGFKNFFAATFRVERYTRMIQEEGPAWIGCRYNPPIIWFPPEGYQRDYQINRKREELLLESSNARMGSGNLVNQPFLLTTSLLYM
jgi:hypothetical protein